MKILITGATGLIGKELGKVLFQQGHHIVVVTRNRSKAIRELPFPCQILEGDLGKSPLTQPISVDAVFHLLGESIANGRWTKKAKQEILQSRVQSTLHLNQSLTSSVKFYLCASGIGIYGNRPGEILSEQSAGDDSFLSRVCQEWEKSADSFSKVCPEATIAKLRIGLVLSKTGGALEKMLFPFKAGVGGPLGSGKHYGSWIHIQDLIGIMLLALDRKISGAINGCSPESAINRDFSRTLAQVLNRPLGPSIPRAALNLLFGEMASILFDDQNAIPKKILDAGYAFRFPNLNLAFKDLLCDQIGTQEIFVTEQYLPIKAETLFKFFSDAKNLESITPPSLKFHIVKISSTEMKSGVEIDYRLKIHGLPVKWKTRIQEWEPNKKFVDTQLKGPYSLWHHTHEFVPWGEGTLMKDSVKFRLPLGYLGWLAGSHFVRSDVAKIFAFRRDYVGRLLTEMLKT